MCIYDTSIHPYTRVYDIGTGQAGEVGVDLTDAGLSAARFLQECVSVCLCLCVYWPKRSQIRRGAGSAAPRAQNTNQRCLSLGVHTCMCLTMCT